MLSLILIALFSLIALLVLHEFSHFIVAKKFKVEVEEFGIGYPPRLFGKKIGKTLYSLNLIPFGAFVKIPEHSLRKKSIGQQALIIVAGIVSFWLICILLITSVLMIGAPFQIPDEETGLLDSRVELLAVAADSPAEAGGLIAGDVILVLGIDDKPLEIDKVQQVQDFTDLHKGEEIVLTIERGKEIFDVFLVPRTAPPVGEGPLGVSLIRVATKRYPLFEAFSQGIVFTFRWTGMIISGLGLALKNIFLGQPSGMQLVGPIGIFDIFVKSGSLGITYFLQTMALVALHLAIFNALPIPVADGGRLLFLLIEKVRGKPINEEIEKNINLVFFFLLIFLMAWVTIKDVIRIF